MEVLLFILILFACVYFLPSIIAAYRDTVHLPALFLLNLFLGWTFFGWVLTLFIAILIERRDEYELRRYFLMQQAGTLNVASRPSKFRKVLLFVIAALTVLLVVGMLEKGFHIVSALQHYTSGPASPAEF